MLTTVPADWITVAEVKAHMDKTSTADDAELAGFVSAACEAIRERIGEVSEVTAVVEARSWTDVIVLEHKPVVSITKVERLPGLELVPEGDRGTGADGWLMLQPGAGVLTHTSRFPGEVRVTYQAGRDPLPGNVRLAGLELAAHLWRASQLNAGGGRPAIADNEQPIIPGIAYALPIRVRELLGLGNNPTSEVLIG
ncbi:phage gp6-like head-tail connector protein [Actinomadura sp. KC216]|uniref:phage gp6-like head-tail connector protein n=1 Tax=Actinomadura sp. KC216 TaxID=2530370 RepID=UPI0010506350|nr:phage gp6-like head-tail connector protein [Actinomadura sp. KC216]TDB88349.1 phage gp6-like head-tail connector protein [Actinomadura sp. KC216]